MFSFGKSGKSSGILQGRHMAAAGPAAEQGAGASLAESMQLQDLDPVHSVTSTEQLRDQNAKYAKLWPSDLPHKRR